MKFKEECVLIWNKTEEAYLFKGEFRVPRKRISPVSGEDTKSSFQRLFFKITDAMETSITLILS